VVASATESEVLAPWLPEAAVIGGLAGLLDLLTAAGIWLGQWSLKDHARLQAAETQLLRRQAEASEDRFRLLVEHAPDAITILDADRQQFIAANAQAEALLGRPKEEILRIGPMDVCAPEQPYGPLSRQVIEADIRQAFATGRTDVERRLRKASGEERLCKVTFVALPFTAGGRLIRVSAIDITEDREAERLRSESLERTIGALASTVEARDPYTAGHQLRVAKLAAAIGRKLGMTESDVRGVYLAGLIHDIGKIVVPSEFLSKPGRLSKIEFSLVREHAEAGYNIIKGIQFPWPIAEMVRQHHERLDGSGYPRGLSGEAILPGARILAVADVVDAMMSHRPYRPALGIEAALTEITAQRGRFFDKGVVDACIAAFREDEFRLE
jgi:PAS domain S-box-containing protein/putative nucleotidyltransferase with HDIG domain